MKQKKVERRVAGVMLTVLMVVFGCGVSIGAITPQQDQLTTATLIEKTFSAYEHLKSFYTEGKTTFSLTANGETQSIGFGTKMAFQRPNKFYTLFDHPTMGFEVICDGKVLYSYLPSLKQFRKMNAPATIKEIDLEKVIAPGARAGGLLSILIAEDPKSTILRNTISAKMLNSEKLGDKTYYVMQLEQSDKSKVNLYIEPDTFLIKRMYVDMTDAAKARSYPQTPPSDLKITLTENYEVIKSNEKLSEELFAFKPPEGAKEVKSFIPPKEEAEVDLKGEKAPEFTLHDLEGITHSLVQQKGKVVVLDFWATWCGPCRMSIPFIQKLHEQYKDKGVVVWGINAERNEETVKKFVAEQKLTYPILRDVKGEVFRKYSVSGIPRILLIDQEGKVVVDYTGFSKDAEKEMEETIKKLLEK